nr:hypothetical protein [Tanacetum cinerariifolium]
KWQMDMLFVRVHKFEQKAGRKIDFDKKESFSCDSVDAIRVGANKLYNLINGANSEEANTPSDAGELALIGVTSE